MADPKAWGARDEPPPADTAPGRRLSNVQVPPPSTLSDQ